MVNNAKECYTHTKGYHSAVTGQFEGDIIITSFLMYLMTSSSSVEII